MTAIALIMYAFIGVSVTTPTLAKGAHPLTGLWGTTVQFGQPLQGELSVVHESARWIAAIDGQRTTFTPDKGMVRFGFGSKGRFRGEFRGRQMRGFLISPSSDSIYGSDPGGASQSFASPITLRRKGKSKWSGTIVPLYNRFTLWLSVFRAADGTLMAAFRNPELNSNGGASRFLLTRIGDALRFEFKDDRIQILHQGKWLRNPERIRLQWPDIGRSLDLTRRSGPRAAAFFPRAPGAPPYVYRRPPQLRDGWRTARASATGLDETALANIVRERASSDPTARPPQLMDALLVAHHGYLVLEEYFYGLSRDEPHDIRSAGKTFASVMLGTAPAMNAGLSPDSRIYELFKDSSPFANADPRKAEITLTQLMTHTSGLACDDNDEHSPGNEATMQSQTAEPNWWRYTLSLPVVHDPGSRYAYCSAGMNLIGGALTKVTGVWLPELFARTVAEPLQFGRWYWNLMPTDEGYLGGGAFLQPRDLLKVGQMYLNGGVWNGRRIVPADWIATSTKPAVEVSPATTGLSEDEFGNFYGRGEDGLAWHLGTLKSGGRAWRTYAAVGNGGQILLVVPDADLVVVFTGANYGQGGVWGKWPQQIVGDRIIPTMRN